VNFGSQTMKKTRLIARKPSEAINSSRVERVDLQKRKHEVILPHDVLVRYLYAPGDLEGGKIRHATDPIWSLSVHQINSSVRAPNQPVIYYLDDGPKRAFVKEELQIVR